MDVGPGLESANGAAHQVILHRADNLREFRLFEAAARAFLVEPEQQWERRLGPELQKTLESLMQFGVPRLCRHTSSLWRDVIMFDKTSSLLQ